MYLEGALGKESTFRSVTVSGSEKSCKKVFGLDIIWSGVHMILSATEHHSFAPGLG